MKRPSLMSMLVVLVVLLMFVGGYYMVALRGSAATGGSAARPPVSGSPFPGLSSPTIVPTGAPVVMMNPQGTPILVTTAAAATPLPLTPVINVVPGASAGGSGNATPQMPATGGRGWPFELRQVLRAPQMPAAQAAEPLRQAGYLQIGRLVIPSIGVDTPIALVESQVGLVATGDKRTIWTVPDFAAGYHSGSAWPGQIGNTVISGHNNLGSQVFQQLEEIQRGDPIYVILTDDTWLTYTVVKVMILPEDGQPESVRLENARYIGYFPDLRLTLVSCWPDWTNTERVVVIAQ